MASLPRAFDDLQTPYRLRGTVPNRGALQADALLRDLDDTRGFVRIVEPGPNIGLSPERAAFNEHYAQWLEDSLFDSLPQRMTRHDSYKAIVELGDRAVPLIATELRKKPSFIFLALEDITQADPVPDKFRGDLQATVAAWLSWLRK